MRELIILGGLNMDFTNVYEGVDASKLEVPNGWNCPHQECYIQLDIMLGIVSLL